LWKNPDRSWGVHGNLTRNGAAAPGIWQKKNSIGSSLQIGIDDRPGVGCMKDLLEYKFLIPLVLLLGLAPFFPKPHIVEKVWMLLSGTLKRPIDIFDLVWHSWPFALLTYKVVRDITSR